MRLSIALLVLALLGVVGGAALISVPAIGGAVIFDSLVVGLWTLLRDDGKTVPQVVQVPGQRPVSLMDVLQRSRAS